MVFRYIFSVVRLKDNIAITLKVNSCPLNSCFQNLTGFFNGSQIGNPETSYRILEDLKYLEDLKIKCDYHDCDCTDEVRLEDLQRHVDQCGFTPVMCENEKCGMVVNKRDKENHERNLCQFRIIKCHDCQDIKTNQHDIKVGKILLSLLEMLVCFVDLLQKKLLYTYNLSRVIL